MRFADGVTPTAESSTGTARKFVGQYLELNATLADGACASDVTKCAQDVLQVLELEDKIECDIGAHEGVLFLHCLLNPSYLEETSSSNYVHRIQTVLGQNFLAACRECLPSSGWSTRTCRTRRRGWKAVVALAQRPATSPASTLVDMHTFDSAVVVQAARLLNQAKTDFKGQVAAIDGIVYLSVGTARYGGRHITSCSQEIAGRSRCMASVCARRASTRRTGNARLPPNYWCSLNEARVCAAGAQQRRDQVESLICACAARNGYQHGSACTRCRQGFYCPGVYEFGMQACPAAPGLGHGRGRRRRLQGF